MIASLSDPRHVLRHFGTVWHSNKQLAHLMLSTATVELIFEFIFSLLEVDIGM